MDRTESLQKHVADMLAVEKHILEAIERQRAEENVRQNPEVNELVIKLERIGKQHIAALEALSESYGGDGQSAVKKAVTGALGVAAGLWDQVRGKHPLSRILRDDYTALSLSAMAYTMMHTFGLAVKEEKVARLAEQHLKDLTPLLVNISKRIPEIVVLEVAEENEFPVDTSVARQAVANTQAAWRTELVESV